MSLTGAQYLIEQLEQQGVRCIAGVPGGAVLPLYEALGRSSLIRHVLARHEQAAGFIAQGIGRVSGRPGVCLVTSGPGVTNVVTALADARLDSIPLVCIAGQVPTALIGTDAFQEVATPQIVRSVTKACLSVSSAAQLRDCVPQAFALAEGGRPGPVLIEVPKDVQLQHMEFAPRAHHAETRQALAPSPGYDAILPLLQRAARPLLYCGGGVVRAGAQALWRELAELAVLPMTTSLMGLGILPQAHPLNLGMLGMHGARYTNLAIEAADLIIAVGARFDDRATGDPRRFAPHARIVHIDIDAREFGKIISPTLAICDDAGRAGLILLQRLRHAPRTPRAAWQATIAQLRQRFPLQRPRGEQLCSPYGIMRTLSELLPADAVVTTDVGQHQMWAAQALAIPRSERWLTSGGLGTMGFGLPAAIGAALQLPQARVVCITGDGSLLMNVQELATLAELGLNVTVLLLDNGALGLVHQQQALFYQQRFVGSKFSQPSDFIAIARAFGVRAYDLAAEAQPRRTLAQALTVDGPNLIRVPIDRNEQVLPMVAPGEPNTHAIDHALETA